MSTERFNAEFKDKNSAEIIECGRHKKLKLAAKSVSVAGPFRVHDVFNALQIHSLSLEIIQSIHYSCVTGINMRISSSSTVAVPELKAFTNPPTSPSSLKFVITALSAVPISFQVLTKIISVLSNITTIKVLNNTPKGIHVLELQMLLEKEEVEKMTFDILKLSQQEKIDLNMQPESVFRRHKRLVIFDMDSTLIKQEVIDELAREAGVYSRISSITESAMRGEIDFNESLRQRVGLLTGVSASVVETVRGRIEFTPGAFELCTALKKLGYKLAVLSGGFMPLALYVKTTLGLDYAFANTLEISPDGKVLSGRVTGTIVNGEKKADFLRTISQLENIPKEQIIAIGDGANDLMMMAEAGLGIAYNAKPKVQMQAETRINLPNLLNVLYLLGFSKDEISILSS